MSLQRNEQSIHDRINLGRLVRRLEKSVSVQDWNQDSSQHDIWIKAQRTLQGIKHARKLLNNVEADDLDLSAKSAQRYRDMRIALDRTEDVVLLVDKRVAPKHAQLEPILSTIPIPKQLTPSEEHLIPANLPSTDPVIHVPVSMISLPTGDLLLSPSESSTLPSVREEGGIVPNTPSIVGTLPSLPTVAFPLKPTRSTTTATPGFVPSSNALQQELSEQLAQMATQLKKNAIHFSESLAQDQAVVTEAQEKLEGNHDIMKKERLRVRDLRGKTGSTTCLVITSVIAVFIAFVFMVLVIRAT